jgi:hypothetical protein
VKRKQEYTVHRVIKGVQVYVVDATSRNDAIRQVLDGGGQPVSFVPTTAARTAQAWRTGEASQ